MFVSFDHAVEKETAIFEELKRHTKFSLKTLVLLQGSSILYSFDSNLIFPRLCSFPFYFTNSLESTHLQNVAEPGHHKLVAFLLA